MNSFEKQENAAGSDHTNEGSLERCAGWNPDLRWKITVAEWQEESEGNESGD